MAAGLQRHVEDPGLCPIAVERQLELVLAGFQRGIAAYRNGAVPVAADLRRIHCRPLIDGAGAVIELGVEYPAHGAVIRRRYLQAGNSGRGLVDGQCAARRCLLDDAQGCIHHLDLMQPLLAGHGRRIRIAVILPGICAHHRPVRFARAQQIHHVLIRIHQGNHAEVAAVEQQRAVVMLHDGAAEFAALDDDPAALCGIGHARLPHLDGRAVRQGHLGGLCREEVVLSHRQLPAVEVDGKGARRDGVVRFHRRIRQHPHGAAVQTRRRVDGFLEGPIAGGHTGGVRHRCRRHLRAAVVALAVGNARSVVADGDHQTLRRNVIPDIGAVEELVSIGHVVKVPIGLAALDGHRVRCERRAAGSGAAGSLEAGDSAELDGELAHVRMVDAVAYDRPTVQPLGIADSGHAARAVDEQIRRAGVHHIDTGAEAVGLIGGGPVCQLAAVGVQHAAAVDRHLTAAGHLQADAGKAVAAGSHAAVGVHRGIFNDRVIAQIDTAADGLDAGVEILHRRAAGGVQYAAVGDAHAVAGHAVALEAAAAGGGDGAVLHGHAAKNAVAGAGASGAAAVRDQLRAAVHIDSALHAAAVLGLYVADAAAVGRHPRALLHAQRIAAHVNGRAAGAVVRAGTVVVDGQLAARVRIICMRNGQIAFRAPAQTVDSQRGVLPQPHRHIALGPHGALVGAAACDAALAHHLHGGSGRQDQRIGALGLDLHLVQIQIVLAGDPLVSAVGIQGDLVLSRGQVKAGDLLHRACLRLRDAFDVPGHGVGVAAAPLLLRPCLAGRGGQVLRHRRPRRGGQQGKYHHRRHRHRQEPFFSNCCCSSHFSFLPMTACSSLLFLARLAAYVSHLTDASGAKFVSGCRKE